MEFNRNAKPVGKKRVTKRRKRKKNECRVVVNLSKDDLAKLDVIGQDRGLGRHLIAEDLLKDLLSQYEEKEIVVRKSVLRRRPGRQADVVNKT